MLKTKKLRTQIVNIQKVSLHVFTWRGNPPLLLCCLQNGHENLLRLPNKPNHRAESKVCPLIAGRCHTLSTSIHTVRCWISLIPFSKEWVAWEQMECSIVLAICSWTANFPLVLKLLHSVSRNSGEKNWNILDYSCYSWIFLGWGTAK